MVKYVLCRCSTNRQDDNCKPRIEDGDLKPFLSMDREGCHTPLTTKPKDPLPRMTSSSASSLANSKLDHGIKGTVIFLKKLFKKLQLHLIRQ